MLQIHTLAAGTDPSKLSLSLVARYYNVAGKSDLGRDSEIWETPSLSPFEPDIFNRCITQPANSLADLNTNDYLQQMLYPLHSLLQGPKDNGPD